MFDTNLIQNYAFVLFYKTVNGNFRYVWLIVFPRLIFGSSDRDTLYPEIDDKRTECRDEAHIHFLEGVMWQEK